MVFLKRSKISKLKWSDQSKHFFHIFEHYVHIPTYLYDKWWSIVTWDSEVVKGDVKMTDGGIFYVGRVKY